MLSLHIITLPQEYVRALRSTINKTKHQILIKHKFCENWHYFGVYTAAMGFTSDACWFLLIKTLLIKSNKKREKMKRAGTRNIFFFTWPYIHAVKPLPRCLAKTLWHGKAMAGKWVIWVHVERDIFLALTGSELFYQFRPQGFPKLADDRAGAVRDVCFEVLFQSMSIDERFLCGYRLIIDWPIPIDTN